MMKRLTVLIIISQLLISSMTWADGTGKPRSLLSWPLRTLSLLTALVGDPLQTVTAQQTSSSVPFLPCPRFPVGSTLVEPQNLFSSAGLLSVSFAYQTRTDEFGNTLYCYMTPDGQQAPVLHVKPGDQLFITLTNEVPTDPSIPPMPLNMSNPHDCGTATSMDSSSANIHFHGMNIAPTCHKDNVVSTLVNTGQTFTYGFTIPKDLPPGLYAYHDHVHGQSEAALQGGASGAIVVQGIENSQPTVAGLPERVLILRDNLVPGNTTTPSAPAWDISLNYIPIPYPNYNPVILPMKPQERQFWRVANEGADTNFDIQILYDGVPQPLEVVALDGVPTGSQDGTGMGTTFSQTHIPLGPLARAEFIVTGPSSNVTSATFVTLNVDTGPDGDYDPYRPIAAIQTSANATEPALTMPTASGSRGPQRFHGLRNETVATNRTLYFSELLQDPSDPASPTNFYITVDGQTPALYSSGMAPAITATQGTVEDWVIENQAQEMHVFHIHQIHFLVLEKNGIPVAPEEQQYLDTIQVPYWSGNSSDPYPSVKVRMDFRGPDIGKFVYHCHILGHEDNGMMAEIQVVPNNHTHGSNSILSNSGSGSSSHSSWNGWKTGTVVGAGTSAILAGYIVYDKWTAIKSWVGSWFGKPSQQQPDGLHPRVLAPMHTPDLPPDLEMQ